MRNVLRELRHAARVLVKNPLVSIVILVTLALGTGATITIFSVVEATLLRPLPYEHSDRLVMVWWANDQSDSVPVSLADFYDWREQSESFELLAAYHPWSFTLTGEGEAERLHAAVVTTGLFEMLGARPQLGRAFESDGPGTPQTVMLSDDFWQRRFGAERDIVGKKLTLDGEPYEVQGVLPAGFRFPPTHPAEVFRANRFGPDTLPRDMRYLRVLGRLEVDVTAESAQAEMSAIAGRHEQEYPDTNTGLGARVETLRHRVVEDFEQALLFLQLAVLLVLAIACFNVAILQSARMQGRRAEIATRLTLGAGRSQLFRQLLSENLLLGVLGGALGLAFAYWGVRLLIRFGPQVHRLEEAGIDGRVLGFTVIVALACGLIFGLAPAVQARRQDFGPILREGGRGSIRAGWLRNAFVFLQVAVTLVLLVGAGLLIRSFDNLRSVSPGFRTDHLLTLQFTLPESKSSLEQISTFYRELKERVEGLPGAESLATAVSLPLGDGMSIDSNFEIEGRPAAATDPQRQAQIRPVSPGFFDTLGIPTVAGRTFTEHDDATGQAVAVINEEMARRYWSGDDPVGDRIGMSINLGDSLGRLARESWQIVGVVGDVKHQGLQEETQPEVYFSTLQSPWLVTTVIVRTSLAAGDLVKPVTAEIQAMDPNLPILKVRTMEEILGEALSQSRFQTWLLGFFAFFALVLTAVGLYGVLSYSVTQRSREIGLRMALGARRKEVVRLVVGRGMLLALGGLAAGLAGSFLLVRLLTGLLFGVSSSDPLTFAGVTLTLALVALVASYFPARRAAALDPVVTLRYE